ncbi:DNA/RNA nuclease SfsA [Alteromonas ponticola]|uniref:Sugar fermentation stimulation protein homolog n=1 Tax=Alteromonas aquimaris TaxID=2998417 RepID=A0ABT3PB01_9ALTE|nr:DNA/RNA nuclease SfsA [Alteromonas aquimaris]MCW8109246.1 DNA/RNA nuclease SfsA [Alteromonas aquimaris]
MKFSTPLIKGKLIKRYKRFLADVQLDDGSIVTAHCPNTGAMTGCAEPGFTAYLRKSDDPKRKLKYTWEIAQTFNHEFIGVNTHNANKLIAEALADKKIPGFEQVQEIKSEVKPSGYDSRFDFRLTMDNEPIFVEVKSVTLAEDDSGYFPDAKTIRGAKHCLALAELARQDVRAELIFCVQHTGIKQVKLARHIDPAYADSVLFASQNGVNVRAFGCEVNEQKIAINQQLPIIL